MTYLTSDRSGEVLLVEDRPKVVQLVREMFASSSLNKVALRHVACLSDALHYLRDGSASCVLLDLGLDDASGLAGVVKIREAEPAVPIVVLTTHDNETLAVQAMRQGAQDYLIKGQVDGNLISRAIRYAIERKRSERIAERVKDEFLATVSHELRTPLTSIRGYAELLLSSLAQEGLEEERDFVEVITRNTGLLEQLVQDVLLVARLGAAELEIQASPLDLSELTACCVGAARPKASEKQIELTFVSDGAIQFRGDWNRLAQLVDNLISNALKYTPEGGRIDVFAEGGEGQAVIKVQDTGIGIPFAEQKLLFDRFFRGTTAEDRAIPGVGLGLTIAKAIAEAHGGKISAESAPGAGSTFLVELHG